MQYCGYNAGPPVTYAWISGGGGLGVGQTWQNLTASRSLNSTYTNTTGGPISIAVTLNRGGDCNSGSQLYINGNLVMTYYSSCSNLSSTVTAIIPDGNTYSVVPSVGSNALTTWYELR